MSQSATHPDPSLSYPRILCLHGMGTNSRIYRVATRVMKSQLSNHVRLVYADAPFFAPPGPFITGVFTDWGPFRAWLPPALGIGPGKGQGVTRIYEDPDDTALVVERIEESLRMAMEVDDRAGGTGPWVGLLAFSQGAKIAASLLLRQQHANDQSGSLPAFHFGVLMAGPAPLVSLDPSRDHTGTGQSPPQSLLQIPTIHVHGKQDSLVSDPDNWIYPGCSPDSTRLFVWDGGHDVPTKTKDVAPVVEAIMELLGKHSH